MTGPDPIDPWDEMDMQMHRLKEENERLRTENARLSAIEGKEKAEGALCRAREVIKVHVGSVVGQFEMRVPERPGTRRKIQPLDGSICKPYSVWVVGQIDFSPSEMSIVGMLPPCSILEHFSWQLPVNGWPL